jgi:hypothetical protein
MCSWRERLPVLPAAAATTEAPRLGVRTDSRDRNTSAQGDAVLVSEVWVLAEGACGVSLAIALIRGAVRDGTLCPDGVARRKLGYTATTQIDANKYI